MADEHSENDAEIPTPIMSAPDPEGLKWFREHSIPIAGIILIFLVFCIVSHFLSATGWTKAKDITDVLLNIVQMAAFIAGGWWAYFKFIKGRTFKESLVPAVRGKFVSIDDIQFLIVTTQIKNVGLSKIEFNREGSALIIFEYNTSSETEIYTVAANKLGAFDVLNENDKYIEPNEIIEDTRLIAIPGPLKPAYRLEVQIASAGDYTWQTATIVDKSPLSGRIATELIGL
jgi:hypothetical protein